MPTSADDTELLLSLLPPSRQQKQTAFAIIAFLVVVIVATAPYGAVEVPFLASVLASMQSLILAADLLIAVLLYAQFAILGWRSLLGLAGSYVYSAILCAAHYLSYPGAVTPEGVMGPQTTGWLFIAWHSALPIATIVYAARRRDDREERGQFERKRASIAFNALAMVGLACFAVVLSIAANRTLPPIFSDGAHLTPMGRTLDGGVAVLILVALCVLWKRRQSALDLWLVTIFAVWLISIFYAGVFVGARFTFGFYVVRAYWLVTALIIPMGLLTETATLYDRLTRSFARRQREG